MYEDEYIALFYFTAIIVFCRWVLSVNLPLIYIYKNYHLHAQPETHLLDLTNYYIEYNIR
jgi:hypothetical protein